MDASTQATRCLERLFRKHAQEFQALDEFQTADRSFCPELWDAQQTEPLFHSTPNEIGDRLLLAVARAFKLNPTVLDDAMMTREWEQHHRQVAQALSSGGVCAYHLVGEVCRNAPIDRPGACGCRRTGGPSRAEYDELQRLAALDRIP